ncbi:MAG TPA: PhoU domain-containing protein [Ktedonosporobacter sp.]|nr:PhoU domain-containing protein [Ktedonosporobacter sp.]
MTRILLDNELYELNAEVLHLGSLVDDALAQALEALKTEDQEQAEKAVIADQDIDELHVSIERQTFDLLVTQQPLGGRDLRSLTSLPPIAVDLERIGDEATDIAQMVLRIAPLLPVPPTAGSSNGNGGSTLESTRIHELLDLGLQARSMLQRTMQAFADRDAEAAKNIWLENAATHTRCYAARCDISADLELSHAVPALLRDPHALQHIMCLLAIVHCLERVGDHCTNVCERIVYMVLNETEIQPVMQEV